MRDKWKYIILILFSIGLFDPAVKCQKTSIHLSRTKTLSMLLQLDTLITKYASYCSYTGEAAGLLNKQLFLALFDSDTICMIDDVNPNIETGSEDIIREQVKSVDQYISDIHRDFNYFNSSIIRSNASSAAERLYHADNQLYFQVTVLKRNSGELKDSLKARTISSIAELELWIRLYDTLEFDMKIAGISKVGPLGVHWDYTYAAVKNRNVETHFYLKPAYSVLYPYGPKVSDRSNIYIDHNNSLMDFPGSSDIGLSYNNYWGSFGLNGEMEFRFYWRKDEKHKTKGFSIGIGGGWYNSYFQADNYVDVYEEKDKDDDPYYRITEVLNLKEKLSIISLDIPVKYSTERWKDYRKGRYFKFGTRLSYVKGNSRATGTYTRTGYYPGYRVLLENIDDYDFTSDNKLNEKYPLDLNQFNIALEMTVGKKHRSRSGNTIFYTGINCGVYLNSFIRPAENKDLDLITRESKYNGILSLEEAASLAYVGLVFGIRKADVNELILSKKRILHSIEYSDNLREGYSKVNIDGIHARDYSKLYTVPIDMLGKKDRPVFQRHKNKDPRKFLDDYLDIELSKELSQEEKKRILKEKDRIIHFSFVLNKIGLIREVTLENQNETKFGQELFRIIYSSSRLWSPGNLQGIPVNTLIEMTYKYKGTY